MGVTKEQLESSLTSKMNPSYLEVIDTSGGCGASFVVEIVSAQFEGKRLLERHRMVNAALGEEMIMPFPSEKPSPPTNGSSSSSWNLLQTLND